MSFNNLPYRSIFGLWGFVFSLFLSSYGHAQQALCPLGEGESHRRMISEPLLARQHLSVTNSGSFERFISRFNGAGFRSDSIKITGSVDLPEPVLVNVEEDNGSIPLATELNLLPGSAVVIDSELGDGPFASEPGKADVDFYQLSGLVQGQSITISASGLKPSPEQAVPEDPNQRGYSIFIYDSNGVDIADFSIRTSSQESFGFTAPSDGDYFILVIDFLQNIFLQDLFDSSSVIFFGPAFGLNVTPNTGAYRLEVGLDYSVEQTFKFFAKPGVVISGALTANGNNALSINDPDGSLRIGSTGMSPVRSSKAPFPQGNVELVHVADKLGVYEFTLSAFSGGEYELELRADLPPLSQRQKRRATQVILLDFEAATIAANTFVDEEHGEVSVSGLTENGLNDLGLTLEDKDALIDQIIETVERQVRTDIKGANVNDAFDIVIKNSRDHKNVWGEDNVSRVVINDTNDAARAISGGGIFNGLAQSVDVGNFDTEETAIIILKNFDEAEPGATGLRFLANQLGNVISHEIGHFLGNYHAFAQDADAQEIMRPGGGLIRAGEDGVFGTEDDVLPAFGFSLISSTSLFGFQDAVSNIAFGNVSHEHRTGSSSSSFSFARSGDDVSVNYTRKENGKEVESFNTTSE